MMNKQAQIEAQLSAQLQPEWLQVLDESHMHSRGRETHYKVIMVSPRFAGLSKVRRHQLVYAVLGELMGQIHALAIHPYTAEEWQAEGQQAPLSPKCSGGSKHA